MIPEPLNGKKDERPPPSFKAYLVTNSINGKKYIGVTEVPLDVRWAEHVRVATGKGKRARRFHNAIIKYGAENFTFQQIASARSRVELAALETLLIKQEDTFWIGGHGYNMTRGGEGPRGVVITEETRAKMRKAQTGRITSDATKEKLRITSSGKSLSAEARAKISAARKAAGPYSPERRLVQAEILRAVTPEQREKAAAKTRGRKQSPEWVEKRIAPHRGMKRPIGMKNKLARATRDNRGRFVTWNSAK